METASFTPRRVAPFLVASILLTAFAEMPAHAIAPLTLTPFNGSFDTTVALSGFSAVGSGASTNSPLGITTESFVYNLTSFSPNQNGDYPVAGTDTFSNGSDTLVANVVGEINISNYTGDGTDVFNAAASTGKFAGATGTATFTATVLDQSAKTITDQYNGSVVLPAAVPEASSMVSLGLLLALGLGGAVIAARRKSAV